MKIFPTMMQGSAPRWTHLGRLPKPHRYVGYLTLAPWEAKETCGWIELWDGRHVEKGGGGGGDR